MEELLTRHSCGEVALYQGRFVKCKKYFTNKYAMRIALDKLTQLSKEIPTRRCQDSGVTLKKYLVIKLNTPDENTSI